uniref:Proliferating cell nuclear antigen PCNA N-terminal domain-containing protein n=1 Tax=viral metagenome TaxID=1070528 RepID=A0A6C0LBX5_9ZZZZ
MKLSFSDKNKKDIFSSIFLLIKSCTSVVHITFRTEELYIQGMDKSHICLFEIKLHSSWFDLYESAGEEISVNAQIFSNILSMNKEHHSIHISYETDSDQCNIDFITEENKGDFNTSFTIPLVDIEHILLDIPSVEYDAEFSIYAKKMSDMLSQLLIFGEIIHIDCNEETIVLCSKDISGEMQVTIPMNDLSEYAIGDSIHTSYSLTYLSKMCMTTKLSSEIQFAISAEFPMKIKYDLGSGSQVLFFIAPKIE